METRTRKRNHQEAAEGERRSFRQTREAYRDACRLGMRGYRRALSGNADGVLRPADRESAQPERAGADLIGGDVLEAAAKSTGSHLIRALAGPAFVDPKHLRADASDSHLHQTITFPNPADLDC